MEGARQQASKQRKELLEYSPATIEGAAAEDCQCSKRIPGKLLDLVSTGSALEEKQGKEADVELETQLRETLDFTPHEPDGQAAILTRQLPRGAEVYWRHKRGLPPHTWHGVE